MANTLNLGNGQWATKEGSLLGYNSENNNYKPLPFDFSRASTATRVNKQGLIETVGADQPRVDYLNNTKGALLLEPSRTNLETKSNEFSTWGVVSNTTRTADYIISPDGTLNGTRLQFTANGFVANTSQSLATYTVSCYAKRNDNGTQNVGFFTNGSGVVNSAWSLTSEWQRFTYTYTAVNASYAGIAGISGGDVSVFGFQMEEGSYATSYIPTQGSAVTRLADVCKNGGNEQVINSTEGVLYAEIAALADDSTDRRISISDGTTNNRMCIGFDNASNKIKYFLISSNTIQTSEDVSVSNITQFNKIAFKFKANDFKLYINGSVIASDTSGSTFSANTLNVVKFAGFSGTSQNFYGNVKDVRVYNTALTDQELIALTS